HDLGDAPPKASSVTSGVTEGVTVTVEEEGEALRDKSQILKKEVGSSGRDAPPGELPPSEKVFNLSNSNAAQRAQLKAKLKAKLKAQCRQKNIRYVKATCEGEEREHRLIGLVGCDEAHDAQWWLDHIDAERLAANWD